MLFTKPLPFREAIQSLEARSLLPTDLGSRLLREIEPDVLRRAFFSAKVDDARHLQALLDAVNKLAAGTSDKATQRAEIKQLLASLQYQPSEETRGGLQDLSSDRRINLQLDTNLRMMQGAGDYVQGDDPTILNAFPAQELIRVRASEHERDWSQRWLDAGGQFYAGRMIARKDAEVWDRLGDPARFPDGLGNRWAPFAFGSGMGTTDISRNEAVALGVIDWHERVQLPSFDLNADLTATPDVRESWLKTALADALQGVAAFDANGVLRAA